MLPMQSKDFVDIIKALSEEVILDCFTCVLRGRQRGDCLIPRREGNEAEVRMICRKARNAGNYEGCNRQSMGSNVFH